MSRSSDWSSSVGIQLSFGGEELLRHVKKKENWGARADTTHQETRAQEDGKNFAPWGAEVLLLVLVFLCKQKNKPHRAATENNVHGMKGAKGANHTEEREELHCCSWKDGLKKTVLQKTP